MAELKPCPFCGGEPLIQVCDGAGMYHSRIGTASIGGRSMTHLLILCKKCGVHTKAYATERGLFNAWNRRMEHECNC